MLDVWIWPGVILLFAVIAGIYIIRRPASQRKVWIILAIEFILFLILMQIVYLLPLNTLYALTFASTLLLAPGFLIFKALGKRIGAATQAEDETQAYTLFIRILLTFPLFFLTPICIFTLVESSPNIQRVGSLISAAFVALFVLVVGLEGVIRSLRRPTRRYSLRFVLDVALIACSMWIVYLLAQFIFHVL